LCAIQNKEENMLVKWITDNDETPIEFDISSYQPFEVLIAVNRMTNKCLGIIGFSISEKEIKTIMIIDTDRKVEIEEKLIRCAKNQIDPVGGSFHYKYPKYATQSIKEFCPCCNSLPMPEGMEEITELEHSWVNAEPKAQGKLWGKCTVTAKYHSVLFYDMPKEEMSGYMADVQKAAKALHWVSESIKINYEIHMNSGPHLHCHLFPRYLDDDFPSSPIDYRITEPSPYESDEEYRWFISKMRQMLNKGI
jgi:diadenosine tetraphosphate (Ap4A) HIT family hydrolase